MNFTKTEDSFVTRRSCCNCILDSKALTNRIKGSEEGTASGDDVTRKAKIKKTLLTLKASEITLYFPSVTNY